MDAPTSSPTPARAVVARAASFITLALGVFGASLAWGGTLHLARGDASVVLSATLALALAYASSQVDSARKSLALGLGASLLVGGLVGLSVVGAPEGPVSTWFALGGVLIWLFAATARAACAAPLMALLRRGASLATRDALDRVMLASALWLFASLTESLLVLKWMPRSFNGLSGPALGVATFSLVTLGGGTALAALARSLRWIALWRRVLRDDAWRVVDGASWVRSVPDDAWFDVTPLDGVLVRRVKREGSAYREGDVEAAQTRVPIDVSRVTRRLAQRATFASALLVALAYVVMSLGVTLRW